jgi:hypothetical protein
MDGRRWYEAESLVADLKSHRHEREEARECCVRYVAYLTPREGAGQLPALLLDQGQLPNQLPALRGSVEGRKRVSKPHGR